VHIILWAGPCPENRQPRTGGEGGTGDMCNGRKGTIVCRGKGEGAGKKKGRSIAIPFLGAPPDEKSYERRA